MQIMNYKKICLFIILIVVTSLSRADDTCNIPKSPAIPSGSVTEDQLLVAINTVKRYQVDMQAFRDCIDQRKVTVDENMDKKTIEKNRKTNAELDAIYNLSVEKEQAVAELLNKEIRLYKSNEYKNRKPNASSADDPS